MRMMTLTAPNENHLRAAGVDTFVERATSLIYRDILTGALPPDAKLRVHDLAARYKLGPTPIREALSRLCPRGFVDAAANRGFRVHPISRADLEDIVSTRVVIETEALRRSMARGDDEWEVSIISALHRLQKAIARNPKAVREGDAEFDQIHKRFHTSLIAACGSPRLIEMHELLYDQTYRYRAVTFPRLRTRRLDAEHVKLANAVLRRKFEPACACLVQHIRSTLESFNPASKKKTPRTKLKRWKYNSDGNETPGRVARVL